MSGWVLPSNTTFAFTICSAFTTAMPVNVEFAMVRLRERPAMLAFVTVIPSTRTLTAGSKSSAMLALAPGCGLTVTTPGLLPARKVPYLPGARQIVWPAVAAANSLVRAAAVDALRSQVGFWRRTVLSGESEAQPTRPRATTPASASEKKPLRSKCDPQDPGRASANLAVDEARQASERLEDVGSHVLAIDLDAEMLLEGEHQLEHRHGVELRKRAEQRRRRVDLVNLILDAERRNQHVLDVLCVHGRVQLHAVPPRCRRDDGLLTPAPRWARDDRGRLLGSP